jgi:hypothetical protein
VTYRTCSSQTLKLTLTKQTKMAQNLQVDNALSATAQPVKDQTGKNSPLTLSNGIVGVSGDLQVLPEPSTLHFTSVWHGWPSFTRGHAEICNDTHDEKTLMIVGNYSADTSNRRVSIWDRLEINGSLRVTADVDVAGDIRLLNADCAEDFDIAGAERVELGTVMVLGDEGTLEPSQRAYDKRVAGVISGAGHHKPGLVLDRQPGQGNRSPVALLGKVFCKLDAGYASVEVGDLLTTSDTPGHAMKAGDPARAFGAVIGKALRALKEGQALIPILIALQ